MLYLGDFKAGKTIDFAFDTSVNGLPSTLSAATVKVYKGSSSTTEVTTGVTHTEDFDALTGLNHVTIDLSSDGAFYAAGNEFAVVLTAATLGGAAIRRVLAMFSIENRALNWAQVCSPTTVVGLSGTTIKDATDVETAITAVQARLPAALVGGRMDASVGAMAANTMTASALATDAATEIADAVLDRDLSAGTDSGSSTVRTMRQALRFLRNKWSIVAGVLTVLKEDDTTTSWTGAVSTTASDPVSQIDPAGP